MARLSEENVATIAWETAQKRYSPLEMRHVIERLLEDRAEVEKDGWRKGMEVACKAICSLCRKGWRHSPGHHCSAVEIRKLMEAK